MAWNWYDRALALAGMGLLLVLVGPLLIWTWPLVVIAVLPGYYLLLALYRMLVRRSLTARYHVALSGGMVLMIGVAALIGWCWTFPFMPYTVLQDAGWYGLVLLVPLVPFILAGAMEAYDQDAGKRVVVAGLMAYLIFGLLGPTARDLRNLFVIPDGFTGPVRVRLDAACAPATIANSRRVITVGADGTACIGNRDVSIHYCLAMPCSKRMWTDRWARAGRSETPLRTWGDQPQIVTVKHTGTQIDFVVRGD